MPGAAPPVGDSPAKGRRRRSGRPLLGRWGSNPKLGSNGDGKNFASSSPPTRGGIGKASVLKTNQEEHVFCVSQLDHANVSGFLAARWGNDHFRLPGWETAQGDVNRLRAEIIFAIAQHDNGWLEWEASPSIDPADGLPHGLFEAAGDEFDEWQRWRSGVERFRRLHPFASLLIAHHAVGLYAARLGEDLPDGHRHTLWWNQSAPPFAGTARNRAIDFVAEMERQQQELKARLNKDSSASTWLAEDCLYPAVRLLQALDALSLALCSGVIADQDGRRVGPGQSRFRLIGVPRRGWDDLVDIQVSPGSDAFSADGFSIALSPYPFDTEPLEVTVPAKRFGKDHLPTDDWLSAWYGQADHPLRFRLVKG